ncbi:BrnA antitoxin family protein [Methylobacterium indicum]|uniref:CopG family transcriptional regulator n=1 Tax=Methylobacterium indicum TaxID=1775910 RepID=A0ABR5HGH7_9HYPH|nr:BrnA antitoxin family protein [Methylobacterium indicum]KMO13711.1 hypothetical protein QR78_24905 [Methylobacterium indicum]KMO25750.1 hypothetical protein QR79_06070 [Methylobacterium indicum]
MTASKPDMLTSSDEVWHDPDDAPELTDEFFERAFHYEGGKLIRRGREPGESGRLESIELPVELLDRFRAFGNGWEMILDTALRQWLQKHDSLHDAG